MRRRSYTGRVVGWVGILLLSAGGCTISIQPWTKPVTIQSQGPVDSSAPGFVPVGGFQGPMPKPHGPPPPAASNETMVQLIKQYNEADDHRKALIDQVSALKKQVKEREDNLRLASHEMEESSTKLKRTRDEFRQWETEMTEMRDRVRKLEDNRRAVALLIEEILNHLDRPREPMRLPSLPPTLK